MRQSLENKGSDGLSPAGIEPATYGLEVEIWKLYSEIQKPVKALVFKGETLFLPVFQRLQKRGKYARKWRLFTFSSEQRTLAKELKPVKIDFKLRKSPKKYPEKGDFQSFSKNFLGI